MSDADWDNRILDDHSRPKRVHRINIDEHMENMRLEWRFACLRPHWKGPRHDDEWEASDAILGDLMVVCAAHPFWAAELKRAMKRSFE